MALVELGGIIYKNLKKLEPTQPPLCTNEPNSCIMSLTLNAAEDILKAGYCKPSGNSDNDK